MLTPNQVVGLVPGVKPPLDQTSDQNSGFLGTQLISFLGVDLPFYMSNPAKKLVTVIWVKCIFTYREGMKAKPVI